MLDQRGHLLSYDRALHSLRTWLGMHRQGFDLQLTQYDERGWRATFYTTGMEHSLTSATGPGWERTPWRATQRAAAREMKSAMRRWLRHVVAFMVISRPRRVRSRRCCRDECWRAGRRCRKSGDVFHGYR